MGPRNSEMNHHASALRFFACARPALIKLSVPHPTAYPEVGFTPGPPRCDCVIGIFLTCPDYGGRRVDLHPPRTAGVG